MDTLSAPTLADATLSGTTTLQGSATPTGVSFIAPTDSYDLGYSSYGVESPGNDTIFSTTYDDPELNAQDSDIDFINYFMKTVDKLGGDATGFALRSLKDAGYDVPDDGFLAAASFGNTGVTDGEVSAAVAPTIADLALKFGGFLDRRYEGRSDAICNQLYNTAMMRTSRDWLTVGNHFVGCGFFTAKYVGVSLATWVVENLAEAVSSSGEIIQKMFAMSLNEHNMLDERKFLIHPAHGAIFDPITLDKKVTMAGDITANMKVAIFLPEGHNAPFKADSLKSKGFKSVVGGVTYYEVDPMFSSSDLHAKGIRSQELSMLNNIKQHFIIVQHESQPHATLISSPFLKVSEIYNKLLKLEPGKIYPSEIAKISPLFSISYLGYKFHPYANDPTVYLNATEAKSLEKKVYAQRTELTTYTTQKNATYFDAFNPSALFKVCQTHVDMRQGAVLESELYIGGYGEIEKYCMCDYTVGKEIILGSESLTLSSLPVNVDGSV